MAPGDVVTYVDREKAEHNALVLQVFSDSLNIAYVDVTADVPYGKPVARETSVPYQEEGMDQFYIKK